MRPENLLKGGVRQPASRCHDPPDPDGGAVGAATAKIITARWSVGDTEVATVFVRSSLAWQSRAQMKLTRLASAPSGKACANGGYVEAREAVEDREAPRADDPAVGAAH